MKLQKIMYNHLVHCIFTILCILIATPSSYCDENEQYAACRSSYTCGPHIQDLQYPFWGNNRPPYCGREGFELLCEGNQSATIKIGEQSFRVLSINSSKQVMTIAPPYLFGGDFCSGILQGNAINNTLFTYSPLVRNLSLHYNCTGDFSAAGPNKLSCPNQAVYVIDGDSRLENLTNTCRRVIKIPFLSTPANFKLLLKGNLSEVLNQGFELEYAANNSFCSACFSSNGICGSNTTSNEFTCFCRDELRSRTCSLPGDKSNSKLKIIRIVILTAISAAIIAVVICRTKKYLLTRSVACFRKKTKSDQDLEDFIRNHEPLALKRCSFSNVKKMTNSFKDKLGQGGYGAVYKGKLPDGRLVAVKLLNTSKANGQEFVNEVASISRTSHVNVVALLGFCLEGSKRALIYEYMPNGSLEKFIYNKDISEACQRLGWEKMYQIVIGIARGLEYLHRGCNIRILHFDIKPHNILLDEDFCPKISDFGLAKLCLKKESIVSMPETRGTIGYIAPEVFSRNFGEVSHKSDVYSFGMMVLELVGCKNNLEAGADHTSDLHFPHWIYRQMEQGNEFELPCIETSEENEIAKKMIVVGLWAIQTRPSDRPPINEVLEMLQGSIETLHVPPMPFLSSPPSLPIISSSTSYL